MQAGEKIQEAGMMLLRVGSLLMSNGASSLRIRMIVDRISETFEYHTDLFITNRSLSITVTNKENNQSFSRIKRVSAHGVNFKTVSGISRMSWNVKEQNWSLTQIDEELSRLESLSHYPRLIVLAAVGIADAAFCYFAGGYIWAMLVAFAATILGLVTRQELHKRKFNVYLCVFFASLVATLFSGMFRVLFPYDGFETAFATCVLFLIPGVPLINSFIDMFDGNILNGIVRAGNGLIIAFMIALGLIASVSIYNF